MLEHACAECGTEKQLPQTHKLCGHFGNLRNVTTHALPAVSLLLHTYAHAQAKQVSIIYHLIRRGKTSPLPSVYSRELQSLMSRMMARDPCERPSCAELLQEDILK
jgi:serine/threonine protein kinase